MEGLQGVSFAVSVFSIVNTSACIAVHYVIPKIRKNPGNFVLIQSFLQLFIDINWIFITGFPDTYFSMLPCTVLGAFMSLAAFISYFYCAVISIEIYLQVQSKIISSHNSRTKRYYIISIILGIFIIISSTVTKSYGKNFLGFCFFLENSFGTILYLVYYTCFLVLMWYITIVSLKSTESKKSNLISQYLAMVIATTIIETLQLFSMLYAIIVGDTITVQQITVIFAASLGGFIALFRMWNRELMRDIRWKLSPSRMTFQKKKKDTDEAFLSFGLEIHQEPVSIAECFEKAKIAVRDILESP